MDGVRLDVALVAELSELSRSRLQALVRAGGVSLDGEVAQKPGSTVLKGMRIEVRLPEQAPAPSAAESRRSLEVIHEDEHLFVINKPPGLLTHRTERGGENSLAEHARALYGELPSPQGEDRPGIVHRLDRETSGVIVLGRTQGALEELMRQFKAREVQKTYKAIVHGDPRFHSDWIDEPLGRDERYPERMAVVGEDEGGRAASTFYEVQERFGNFTYLHASPKTGRTHQIRVHLQAIGHPVVGDRVYRKLRGSPAKLPENAPAPWRQMLHAYKLEFKHPVSGEPVSFEAEPPQDFIELLESLRG